MYASKFLFLIKTRIFFKYWISSGQVIIQFIYLLVLCCIVATVECDKDRTDYGDVFDKPRQEKSQGWRKIYVEMHWI
jgi:hypothetical protein